MNMRKIKRVILLLLVLSLSLSFAACNNPSQKKCAWVYYKETCDNTPTNNSNWCVEHECAACHNVNDLAFLDLPTGDDYTCLNCLNKIYAAEIKENPNYFFGIEQSITNEKLAVHLTNKTPFEFRNAEIDLEIKRKGTTIKFNYEYSFDTISGYEDYLYNALVFFRGPDVFGKSSDYEVRITNIAFDEINLDFACVRN